MIIQITIQKLNMADYNEPDTNEAALQLAKELILGHADWPSVVRIDVCDGKELNCEFQPHPFNL